MRWSEFAAARPDLEAIARSMFYEHGLGLGFLATTRADGGPRVHPICPVLADNLYAFIVAGPKLADLRRDPRYALHSETFPPPRHEDGTSLAGRVQELEDPPLRESLTEQILAERSLAEPWPGFDSEPLVELHLDSVLITLTEARHGLRAGHTVWRP
jgi:hypothetical protein